MNRKPKCNCCGERFTPRYNNALQKYCMEKDECIKAHVEYAKKQKEKSWNKEKKQRKQKLKTRNEWMKDLQKVFNTYIRERDKGKPCISCNKPKGTEQAGHYRSVGGNPELRLTEINVHGQCISCNMHKHGNLIEYRKGLIKRIGEGQVEFLERNDHKPLKLSVEEIKKNISHYRLKTKRLKNNQK